MNLNKQKREAIRKAAVKKVYAKCYDEMRRKFRDTLGRIYAEAYAAEIKLAKKLPDSWVNKSERLWVSVSETHVPYEFSVNLEPEMMSRRTDVHNMDKQYLCERTYTQPRLKVDRDSDHGVAILELQRQRRELIKEIDKFADETMAVLASCRTHKQLEESAPELYALMPDEMKVKPSQAVVATETVEAVSGKLREASSA